MTYKADVIKIMIASPSDVIAERRVVRDAIQEWNYVNSEIRQLVLMPIGWDTHSHPEMGGRAQEIINFQILKDCDFLIAVFWTRLGTPTGGSPSGTVEETEKHVASGKPTMIYFSLAPVHPDSVVTEQYSALKRFKELCKKSGLIEEYETIGELKDKISRQLAQKLNSIFPPNKQSAGSAPQGNSPFSPIGNLSKASQELLSEAGKDSSGTIMCLDTMDGFHVQTNNIDFVEQGNARSEAKWRNVIKQLEELGLIEDRGQKGEIYSVTEAGYAVLDYISEK